MKSICFSLFVTYFFVSISTNSIAQSEYIKGSNLLRNVDYTYIDEIKTVKLHQFQQPLTYPIIGLNDGSRLLLTFDDISEDARDYYYEIIHCNADWQPSELTEMDYLDGFNMERITELEFSFNTLTNYVNYNLIFPNQNAKLIKSGNYLIHVFEDGDKELPILTRRFMVAENKVNIGAQLSRTGAVGKSQTHQEIDFSINHKGITIQNPYNDIKVVVTQNGRWDNAIRDLTPLFIREEQLIFDYQDKIVFPAGREHRNFNTQSLKYKTERVERIVEDRIDKYHVVLLPERKRTYDSYTFIYDLNGAFVIENDDVAGNGDIRGDYAWVHFSLASAQAYEKGDVYLFGELTETRIQEKYKLNYDESTKSYRTKLFLKQGYYDYNYAYVAEKGAEPDLAEIEGNWYETENDYHIFVYYRPVGSRYDRLMGVKLVNSIQ